MILGYVDRQRCDLDMNKGGGGIYLQPYNMWYLVALKVKGQELAFKVKASLCVEGHCDWLLFKYDHGIDNTFMKHSLFSFPF